MTNGVDLEESHVQPADGLSGAPSKAQSKRKPYFSPSLALQRRAFVLETLKREGIRSAVELGCGEGSVLSALCQPAAHIDDFPPSVLPPPDPDNLKTQRAHTKLQSLLADSTNQRQLHLRRLAGLDIVPELLDRAALNTAPPAQSNGANATMQKQTRWEPLQVELWQGSLDIYNENLDGYECFVATEVVEHLPNPVLEQFGRIVLGTYAPRLAIVTTPNYDFAPHFPGASDPTDKRGFPDPTGRTNRTFRDSDHKFEWSAREFDEWCSKLASEHDYSYTISGVGSLQHYLHDDSAAIPPMFATQCAVFKKIFGETDGRSPRSPKAAPLAFYQPSPPKTYKDLPAKQPHVLKHSHSHKELASAGQTSSLKKIRQTIKDEMEYMRVSSISLAGLWLKLDIQIACGGYIGKVLESVIFAEDNNWDFEVIVGKGSRATDCVMIQNKTLAKEPESGLSENRERSETGSTGKSQNGTKSEDTSENSVWATASIKRTPPLDTPDASWLT